MSDLQLLTTKDGSPTLKSTKFGVTYHSIHGAIQESEHVFINAGYRYFADKNQLSILEIGLGTGLNAYMTFLENNGAGKQVTYTGIEAFPISEEQASRLNYSELLGDDVFGGVFSRIHDCSFEKAIQLSEDFSFEKRLMKFEALKDQSLYHIIYFDAFGPNTQPELWNEELLTTMYDALLPGGILVTYCAKGVVKRTLKSIGFSIEALAGPPGKREMTRAVKYLL